MLLEIFKQVCAILPAHISGPLHQVVRRETGVSTQKPAELTKKALETGRMISAKAVSLGASSSF
ncbi:MAG: hypothetical protein DLM53_01185 [Candidatus Eremiobacter antarcticus]|nr:MAG: hypothetical protein DLM53_01185 [Candidatus Eremiobacter sp. RRmetagenome_bin22]